MLKMRAFSVTEITRYLKKIIGADPILNQVLIEGEISNFTLHSSGHAYFSIKDEESKMSCMMFAQYVQLLERIPKNGEKVHLKGAISIYERDGRYQMYAQSMTFVGLGALHIQFEALKKELEQEGLFDQRHKKELPNLPQKIGIITSPTGAAIQDIIAVASRRSNLAELLIFPVRVQGEFSASEIVAAIEFFNNRSPVDLIIISRGGGSIEELWSFNEVEVARAIFKSRIPIISGVGHETDFTIADFVADFRAATPSAAAEIAIKSKTEMELFLNQQLKAMQQTVMRKLEKSRLSLESTSPERLSMKLNHRIESELNAIEHLKNQMVQIMKFKVKTMSVELEHLGSKINALSPLSTMQRGYSIVRKEGKLIKSIDDIKTKEQVEVTLSDGKLKAIIEEILKD
ncbi:exodeoxyribonuclease VII large subunit [Fusibacter sp. 3D3]|uniref:exodeoxyribonuclease VII large subunit n=1 Tax=Fusibacter sp. 3D3 TaxID=1048380 RepID=UPI0008529DD1|nr:exodeoxyribonuclease VII large subunit [Fusibacter sp. 3D3]GAU76965.1 exodeoxyribonuclease VII large subunit [Fusibacter sp. 3D3]